MFSPCATFWDVPGDSLESFYIFFCLYFSTCFIQKLNVSGLASCLSLTEDLI